MGRWDPEDAGGAEAGAAIVGYGSDQANQAHLRVRVATVNMPAIEATAPAIGRKTEEVALMVIGWASTPPPHSVECEP